MNIFEIEENGFLRTDLSIFDKLQGIFFDCQEIQLTIGRVNQKMMTTYDFDLTPGISLSSPPYSRCKGLQNTDKTLLSSMIAIPDHTQDDKVIKSY